MITKRSATATEVKNRFGDFLAEVVHQRQPLIVERHGKPVAVIVDYDDWKEAKDGKEEMRGSPWLESYKQLLERIRKKHPKAKKFSGVKLIRQIRDEREK